MKSFYIDIEQVCAKLGLDLEEHGSRLVGLCPFHAETDPSFTVYLETNSFYCFGCHIGGGVLKLVSSLVEEVKSEADLVKFMHDGLGIFEKLPVVRAPGLEHIKDLLQGISSPRMPIAKKSQNPIFSPFDITYVTEGPLAGRHIIPIYFEGKIVAYEARDFTGRRMPKTLIQPPTVAIHSYLWNFDRLSPGEPVIVVEGIKGAIALLSYGEKNVVSSFGAKLSGIQAALLLKKEPTEVVLSYDADEAGFTGTQDAITSLLAWTKVSVVRLPDGCDPWDVTVQTWQECLQRRAYVRPEGKNTGIVHMLKSTFL